MNNCIILVDGYLCSLKFQLQKIQIVYMPFNMKNERDLLKRRS